KPDWMAVIRILASHFFQRQIAETHNVDWRSLSATVALPRTLPDEVRHVCDSRTIGGKPCVFRAPHGQYFRGAAFCWNGVQPVEIRVGVAVRIKEHLLPVRSPPDSDVRTWMPGQALGLATFRRHDENINVSVILPRESDPFSVR